MARKALVTLAVLLLLIVVAGTTTADDQLPVVGSYYMPGNIALSLSGQVTLHNGFGIRVLPGFEYMFTKVRPADAFALDFGAGVRGLAGFHRYSSFDLGYTIFAVAPMITAHIGFRGLGFVGAEFLEPLDVFAGIGPGYSIVSPTGDWGGLASPRSGLGIASVSGFNYFVTDSIAVSLSASYFGTFGSSYTGAWGTGIGVVFRLGPMEELGVRERVVVPRATGPVFGGAIMYNMFVALYWSTTWMSGFWYDDDTFAEGQGIRMVQRYRDRRDSGEIEHTRALLRINADGTKWWRFVFDDEEPIAFEALVDSELRLLKIRYLDPGSDRVVEYTPDDPRVWRRTAEATAGSEVEPVRVGAERITVAAGTFDTERYHYRDDDIDFTWWISDRVPGRIVRYKGQTPDADEMTGELLEILSGV
ncbi:MAG: hypothetical protein EA382_08205, partial [Spirochaetaceae bacterium]